MFRNIALALVVVALSACASTPTGSISPEGKAALEISARIAVRHALADNPRALAKAQNIRSVVAQVQSVLTAESTLGALTGLVSAEIDKLNLSSVDKADAQDLLQLLSVALEARIGAEKLDTAGVARVSDLLEAVLSALPA